MARRILSEVGRALRETGQAIDRVGLRAIDKPIFKEPWSRHRPIMNLFDLHPWTSPDVFVAPNASVIGDVSINTRSSVLYGAVLRGDTAAINIGAYSSIGDRTVVYTAPQVEGQAAANVEIGDFVVIGPGCVLQSCIIQRGAKIGAGAVIMEGALVEEFAEVAPGSVVHPGRRIPKGQEWGGNPAVYVRDVTKEELTHREQEAETAADVAQEHADEFLPIGNVHIDAEAKVGKA